MQQRQPRCTPCGHATAEHRHIAGPEQQRLPKPSMRQTGTARRAHRARREGAADLHRAAPAGGRTVRGKTAPSRIGAGRSRLTAEHEHTAGMTPQQAGKTPLHRIPCEQVRQPAEQPGIPQRYRTGDVPAFPRRRGAQVHGYAHALLHSRRKGQRIHLYDEHADAPRFRHVPVGRKDALRLPMTFWTGDSKVRWKPCAVFRRGIGDTMTICCHKPPRRMADCTAPHHEGQGWSAEAAGEGRSGIRSQGKPEEHPHDALFGTSCGRYANWRIRSPVRASPPRPAAAVREERRARGG